MKSDVVAISGELSHQISSSSNRRWPPWQAIAKVEKGVIRNRVEIVLAVWILTAPAPHLDRDSESVGSRAENSPARPIRLAVMQAGDADTYWTWGCPPNLTLH